MHSTKLKYQAHLAKFPNCPPEEYREVDMHAYRWVHKESAIDDFLPYNLSRFPPRMFETEDENCMSYGLSMFDALESARNKFRTLRKQLQKDKGDSVAKLNLEVHDGLAGIPNQQGHFTFHEYETTDLTMKIIQVYNIFE